MKKAKLLMLAASIFGVSQACYAETAAARLQEFFGEEPVSISPLNAQLSRVAVAGRTYFTSRDGRYIFAGAVIDTDTREDLVEVENRRDIQRQLADLPESWYISYPAKGSPKHTVTVFTDIDCTYCRKMHGYMDNFNDMGITVNYVLMPRAGVGSASFTKAAYASCADDPSQVITSAMNGGSPPPRHCSHTVKEQYELAQRLGINATPTTVLPSGQMQAGVLKPEQLKALLPRP